MAYFYEVTDDSGFLALVDPDAYEGFVNEDWEFIDLRERFYREMAAFRLLIWGTGMENTWRVQVCVKPVRVDGAYREVTGSIRCTKGRLLLTNYESLSMVAQFADQALPQRHEFDQVILLEPAIYRCRLFQFYHPDELEDQDDRVQFGFELLPSEEMGEPWRSIPWFD